MGKFIGKSSGKFNYSWDVQIWSMKHVSVRRKLPRSCWTCTRLSRGCDSSWTRHPERCPLLLIYPARRTRRHRQYHTLCVTVGEYKLQPDTKYSGYLNTQGTWVSLKTHCTHTCMMSLVKGSVSVFSISGASSPLCSWKQLTVTLAR